MTLRWERILTLLALLAAGHSLFLPAAEAQRKGKVQEVNFEEMTMKGMIRNPEGSFLVQKKGLKFYPLYQVQKDMDEKIRSSEPDEVLKSSRRTK